MAKDNELAAFIKQHYGSVEAFAEKVGVNKLTAYRLMRENEGARRNFLKHLPTLMDDTGKSANEITELIMNIKPQ